MLINPKKKSVSISFAELESIQHQLDRLQKVAQGIYKHTTSLTDEEIQLSALEDIRKSLNLVDGPIRVSRSVPQPPERPQSSSVDP